MSDLPPTVLAGNAPESDGTPHISDVPEYLPVAPVVDVTPEVAPVPDTRAPGVYDGNGVLTANVVDGVIVPIPEATVTP